MAYATVIHANARCPLRVFTATSRPTTEQAVQFLEDTAGVLDGVVAGLGYITPVPPSCTQAFAVLRRANAIGAWAEVEQAAPSNKEDQAKLAMKQWADAVALLREGKVQLPDAPRDTQQSFARAGFAATAWFTRNMPL